MAGIFLVISNKNFEGGEIGTQKSLNSILRKINPFGINDVPHHKSIHDNEALLIVNLDSKIKFKNTSVCLGALGKIDDKWTDLECVPPNATFLANTNEHNCILSSNTTASRSIWYYFDKKQLVVSTSQRAIVSWLGSFEENTQAISWMLATGNLGPGNSWDKRIKHIEAGEVIKLDRKTWMLDQVIRDNNFHIHSDKSADYHTAHLEDLLKEVAANSDFNTDDSVLTLSGGYDSRVTLYFLVNSGKKINTITWGLSSVINEEFTDAMIASKIAHRLKLENKYFETDFTERSFDPLFNKFLNYGEGRLDHINSFMDGFKMWENLYKNGVRNIIRADEAFGWLPATNDADVRISLDLHKMEDNSNMLPLENFNIEPQKYPLYYNRSSDESIPEWRDRLYRQFRIPYVLTALHDVINPFMEVFNPLLHENIVDFCKRLPDSARTNKKLYAKYVSSLIPDIPFAKKASIPEPSAILKSAKIVSLLLDEMSSQDTRNILNSQFIKWTQSNLIVDDKRINSIEDDWLLWFKQQIPWRIKKLLRKDFIKYSADFNQLAFRIVIITRMHRLLKSDAYDKVTEK
jgi:asparagine synthetase B (glutamine-hydrolysing)